MIDIWGVIANSLWILGLAVLLAALSWAHWVARTEGKRLRAVLEQPQTWIALNLGLFLFCTGLAASSRAWWERVLWGLLAVAWVFQIWSARRKKRYADKKTTATENRSRPIQVVRWLVGLGVAGLSCWLLMQNVDWQSLQEALISADYRWVIAGVLAIIATFYTRTRRWQALLWHSKVRLQPAMTALLMGQLANLALPMRSGDVIRATWIGSAKETGTVEALGSIAVEKVWDLMALLACGLILLVWIPLPDWFARSTWGTAMALALGGGLLLVALRWQEPLFHLAGQLLARLPAGWDQALLPRLRRLANGLEAIRRTDVSLQAAFWTGLTWALGALANLAILAAFGIPSAVAALFLLAALMVGGTIPTPGKLGIYEGICVLSLYNLFQLASDEKALAVGLVLRLTVMGPPLLTATLLALWSGQRHRSSNEQA